MSTRRKLLVSAPPKAPTPSKRKRDSDSESEDSPDSESELSDLGEDLELEEPRGIRIALEHVGGGGDEEDEDEEDDDDDEEEEEEEEEEEDFDEPSDDDDTPEEAEDSYVFEEEKDVSDEEPRRKSISKPLPKEPAPRSSSRRRPSGARQTPRRRPNTSHPRSSAREPAVAARRSNQKAAPQQTRGGAAGNKAPPLKLTLRVAKDKLREATSNWTPPPAQADSGPGTTAAPTPESSTSATSGGVSTRIPSRAPTMTLPPRAGRGRKIIEADTSSSSSPDEDEDEDEDAEAEEDAEGEEVEVEADAEGGVDDDDGLNDEDAEGETDDEELMDSDDNTNNITGGNTPDFRSRTGTPDMSKLTKRQRSRFDDLYSSQLLELPTGIERPSAAKIVPLTADEAALKRAEMARRRKNLTDQRLEEEKMDTINKLLKKQTPKMRKGRGTGDATPAGGPEADSAMGGISELLTPAPTMVRWVSSRSGTRLGVPESWLAGPAGAVFKTQVAPERSGGRMVEVIDDPMEIDSRA